MRYAITLMGSVAMVVPTAVSSQIAPAVSPAGSSREEVPSGGAAPLAHDDDIVVTAQRRSQNVQEVPIAITAISGDALQTRAIRTIDEIGKSVNNVQVYQDKGGSQPNWTIRGVSLFDFNVNNSPSTAVYIDEIYQPSLVLGAGGIFDLERVEVLKGPQAGLYGRNAIGGAVQVISRTASPGDRDGYLTVDFGSWNRYRIEGGQSITIGSNAALRLSGLRDGAIGNDGWQRSLADGRRWGNPSRTAVRGILSAGTGILDVQLKGFYSRDRSETALATGIGSYSPGSLDFCPAVRRGRRDQTRCATLANLVDPRLPGASAQSVDGRRSLSQPINRLDNREISGVLKVSADLGGATLTSITGYTDFDFGFGFDYDASPLRLGGWTERAKLRNFSQELRLASPSKGAFRWQVGAQYTDYRFREFKQFDFRDNPLLFATFNPIFGIAPSELLLDVTYRQKTRYWAIYGQFDLDITPRLTLTGSLRYSDERTTYRDGRTGFRSIGADLIPLGAIDRDYALGDHFTGSATLGWRPIDGALLYGTVSRGYKSGGIPGGFPQSVEDTLPYAEEFVLNYEGGFKTDWLDRKLQINGAVFYYDHSDLQAFTTLPSALTPGQFVFRLTNIGDGYNLGAEIEIVARPVAGLRLSAAAGYLRTKVTDSDKSFFTFDQRSVAWKGRALDFAPTWSGNLAASYERPVSSDLTASIGIDYNFRTDLRKPASAVDVALREIPGYGLANGRIGLSSAGGWSVAVWSKNLFDRTYTADANNDGVGDFYRIYGEPRSIGVSASRKW